MEACLINKDDNNDIPQKIQSMAVIFNVILPLEHVHTISYLVGRLGSCLSEGGRKS